MGWGTVGTQDKLMAPMPRDHKLNSFSALRYITIVNFSNLSQAIISTSNVTHPNCLCGNVHKPKPSTLLRFLPHLTAQ